MHLVGISYFLAFNCMALNSL